MKLHVLVLANYRHDSRIIQWHKATMGERKTLQCLNSHSVLTG